LILVTLTQAILPDPRNVTRQCHHFKATQMDAEIAFDPHPSKTSQKCKFTSPIANSVIPPSTFQAQAADDI